MLQAIRSMFDGALVALHVIIGRQAAWLLAALAQMGMDPRVIAASAAFMIFFTASSTTLQCAHPHLMACLRPPSDPSTTNAH
jgi:hypothetical protein